jgi:hypothetical protein
MPIFITSLPFPFSRSLSDMTVQTQPLLISSSPFMQSIHSRINASCATRQLPEMIVA